jgi:hypothetical protein
MLEDPSKGHPKRGPSEAWYSGNKRTQAHSGQLLNLDVAGASKAQRISNLRILQQKVPRLFRRLRSEKVAPAGQSGWGS